MLSGCKVVWKHRHWSQGRARKERSSGFWEESSRPLLRSHVHIKAWQGASRCRERAEHSQRESRLKSLLPPSFRPRDDPPPRRSAQQPARAHRNARMASSSGTLLQLTIRYRPEPERLFQQPPGVLRGGSRRPQRSHGHRLGAPTPRLQRAPSPGGARRRAGGAPDGHGARKK